MLVLFFRESQRIHLDAACVLLSFSLSETHCKELADDVGESFACPSKVGRFAKRSDLSFDEIYLVHRSSLRSDVDLR